MITKKQRVGVVGGAGHVGLPLSLLLASRGYPVTIIDINAEKIEAIENGAFPFLENGGPELLKKVGQDVDFTTQHSAVANCEIVILTVGTPIDEHLNPELKEVQEAIDQIKNFLHDGQTLVLRSTLFPGTSQRIADSLSSSGLKVAVCFCPERIAQGNALEELCSFPQIISGSNPEALEVARELFLSFAREVTELSMIEAELAKLYTNAWRYIRFAVANQFFSIAENQGLDFYKIREAMIHNYPRAADFPTAGFAAGPCLFKDTMQLAAFHRQNFPLGQAAMLINETLPDFLVEQVKKRTTLKGKRVGILGMAFKADNDDRRESLAFKLLKLLRYEMAIVSCSDPYVHDPDFVSVKELLDESEIIFIGCPHTKYRSLDLTERDVVDCWGLLRG